MSDFKICNLCQQPGSFDNALEVEEIPSNVRKFKPKVYSLALFIL